MGIILTKYQYQTGKHSSLPAPVIYCYSDKSIGIGAVSLNVGIAEKLMTVKPNRRTIQIPGIVDAVLTELPDGCIVKDFDVLFNPEYRIDVLQLLIAACKKKPINLLWPGTIDDGCLLYAEPGYPDFKKYSIEKYDVTCIV